MLSIDTEIGSATALVVDSNSASRSMLAAALRDLGVAKVTQARLPLEARRLLELRRFDILICDHDFDGEAMSGQDLVDDLRLAQVLPLSTVVVMISAEAARPQVTAAAEAALDAYLIKPHTTDALLQRLRQSRQRKRALKPVFDLIGTGEFAQAAALCQRLFESRGALWVQAARIGAELWLRLGKPQAAQQLFEAVLAAGAVPWARLGVARSLHDRGSVGMARRSLESLLNEQPGYTDAYDVMARVLLGQGLPDEALAASREALSLTPGSVARLVKHGLLAFFYGDAGEAATALTQAARLGLHSRVFDLQGLVLLAFVQFDKADLGGLTQSWRSMAAAHAQRPSSDRLRRFSAVIEILKCLLERQVSEAVALARSLTQETLEPSFEFEAACNLLAVQLRLARSELRPADIDHDVQVLARRFAVSHTSCDMLVRCLRGDDALAAVVKDAYAGVCAEAEAAVSNTLKGLPGQAARSLLLHAESTLNAKLMDLALHTMDRHAQDIDGLDELREQVQALIRRCRSYGTQISSAAAVRALGNPQGG